MKLIINAGSVFKGGAEQVALSFIHECKKFPENDYHIIYAPNLASQLNKKEFPVNFRFHLIKKRPASSIINYFRLMMWFNNLEKDVVPDCVISTGGHGHWMPKVPIVGGFNIPHFIYPESPYFKKLSPIKKLFWEILRIFHMRLYNRLDAVIVQTEDVKLRLSKLLTSGVPIYVISNTASADFFKSVKLSNKLPDRSPGEIRLLTLSSYYPHKNLEVINRITEVLRIMKETRFKFIVTLPEEKYHRVFGANGTGMIYNVGPIHVKECPSLYGECDFMFLPTLLECFSASYAEAMVMKKPILTSDMSFARTVCGDAAIYFNPLDSEDITRRIIHLADTPELQHSLVQKGEKVAKNFCTPYARAEKFLMICKKISDPNF